MRKFSSFFIRLLYVFFYVFIAKNITAQQEKHISANGEFNSTTIIKDTDELDKNRIREKYFENMHRTAPGFDWRRIETQNNLRSYFRNMMPSQITSFANGKLQGTWSERGSNNQAGRLDLAEYDSSTNKLYVLSDNGVLFQGNTDGSGWHVLNDQLRLTGRGLKLIPNGGGHRLVISGGLNTYYTDNDGASFAASSGISFPIAWGGNNVEQIVSVRDNNNTLYCLVMEWDLNQWKPLYYLYQSVNKGATWNKIHVFNEGNENEVALWAPPGQNFLYALENNDGISTVLYRIQGSVITQVNSAASIVNNQTLQFKGVLENNKTKLYVLLYNGLLLKSSDLGAHWQQISSQQATVLGVSLLDSNKVLAGGVNCFRSDNGGTNMTLINDWAAYYSDVANKLHADIRGIYFFKQKNGTEFGIVVGDGGVYWSDNYMNSVHNIGLKGLNVGEFYDVICDPNNLNWLYGGSQDQGFQRTSSLSNAGAVSFNQVISGDYGHLQLTRNNQTLWTQYPGGHIYYYYDSHGNLSNWDFHVTGTFLPEYGWMLPTANVYPESSNQIFIAGGNLNGTDGSYLLKLSGGNSSPYSISASQFNYDFKANSNNSAGISAIGTTPNNVNSIYVAMENGIFFYSTNGGTSWNKSSAFTGPQPWYLYGSTIYASRHKPGLVYYGGSGYSNPGVFESKNGGIDFKPITKGLPPTLVYDLMANPDESLIFAATEAGPFVYSVADSTWFDFDGGIAPKSVSYTSVDFDKLTNTVRFGTFGRGVWDFKFSCNTPGNLKSTLVNDTTASLSWTAVINSSGYSMRYRIKGTTSWSNISTNVNKVTIGNLQKGTSYEWQVQTKCAAFSSSSYSNSSFFSNLHYCQSKGNSRYVFINEIKVGSIDNKPANDSGYGNFTNMNTSLTAGSTDSILIKFTYPSNTKVWANVYIDYNQNGTFDSSLGEIVFRGYLPNNKIYQRFKIPASAKNGQTRMRIQLHKYTTNDTLSNSCATFVNGDVQDYSVTINNGLSSVTKAAGISDKNSTNLDKLEKGTNTISIIPNPVSSSRATAIFHLINEGMVSLKLVSINGSIVYNINLGVQTKGNHNYILPNLNRLQSGYYLVILEQNNQISAYNRLLIAK